MENHARWQFQEKQSWSQSLESKAHGSQKGHGTQEARGNQSTETTVEKVDSLSQEKVHSIDTALSRFQSMLFLIHQDMVNPKSKGSRVHASCQSTVTHFNLESSTHQTKRFGTRRRWNTRMIPLMTMTNTIRFETDRALNTDGFILVASLELTLEKRRRRGMRSTTSLDVCLYG